MEIEQVKAGTEQIIFYCRIPDISQPAQIDASEVQPGTWYVNRLIVPKNARGQGIATALMQELITWANNNSIKLISEINPYGDLDKEQLITFYQKFNFTLTKNQEGEFIIREP